MNPQSVHKSPFPLFDKRNTVFYVESSFQRDLNQFIADNNTQLIELFGAKGVNFCYLPSILENDAFIENIVYNRPYLLNSTHKTDLQEIYHRLISQQSVEIQHGGLLLFANQGSKTEIFASPIDEAFVDIQVFENFLSRFQRQIAAESDNRPSFKIKSAKNDTSEPVTMCSMEVNEVELVYESVPAFKRVMDADADFESYGFQLADEIRERIDLLKELGSLKIIGQIIEELLCITQKLSPLFITSDYRIYLKDYGMQEVEMAPLSKCLFFLFLNHPEGILFKELSNYHDELLSIYRNITIGENIDTAILSIKRMTNPLDNSVNEKCSRIRAAFVELIADDLAKNYYVTGRRGEPKKVELDRSLVEYQK